MLPADLQDPVEVIPQFYRQWSAGTLVVFGERTNRQESFVMRTLRGIYYRVIRHFADGEIPINGLISTSRVPARLALLGGFAFSGIGILAGIWSLIANLIFEPGVSHGIPTLIVALFIFGGIQLFFLGLIGEYVLSIHAQLRQQPPAFDVELINFKD